MSARALVVAGLDPTGGAGLLLDAFVLASLGRVPYTVAACVTAQNSDRFYDHRAVDPALVAKQLEAVLEEGPPGCAKVGAVGSAENARVAAFALGGLDVPVVVDPVAASTSGGSLTGSDLLLEIVGPLAGVATLIAPNAREAGLLAGMSVRDTTSAEQAALTLHERWGCAVVVTGAGRDPGEGTETDVLAHEGDTVRLPHEHVPVEGGLRGTGCIFTSACAHRLGSGTGLEEAVANAGRCVAAAMASARSLGKGQRQVDFAVLVASGGLPCDGGETPVPSGS